MEHHSRRWIYQEGTLVSGSNGTILLSSYSLREIVPERDPIPMIDLLDSEIVDGLVAQGVKFRVSVEEDPSKAESNPGMVPKAEGVALLDTEGMSTFIAGGSPSPLNDIHDTLKYEDALRITFAAFRLRRIAKDWWRRASEARALKDQPWTWNDF
ncbi:hypothetical protein M9H77_36147 [Catharanthus roseus]|uniref:Uncharacterized protein n=1 Tax=Catharanthus roseus TaxID=4058 RepID=A0ACB9ZT64_CATRO|nr:hypothetical protein M9H77_36147 [Catharanthus roseus]